MCISLSHGNVFVSQKALYRIERSTRTDGHTGKRMPEVMYTEIFDGSNMTCFFEWLAQIVDVVSFFASIHPPGFHTHSPRHGVLNWFVNVS
jgi:hypothetical protein